MWPIWIVPRSGASSPASWIMTRSPRSRTVRLSWDLVVALGRPSVQGDPPAVVHEADLGQVDAIHLAELVPIELIEGEPVRAGHLRGHVQKGQDGEQDRRTQPPPAGEREQRDPTGDRHRDQDHTAHVFSREPRGVAGEDLPQPGEARSFRRNGRRRADGGRSSPTRRRVTRGRGRLVKSVGVARSWRRRGERASSLEAPRSSCRDLLRASVRSSCESLMSRAPDEAGSSPVRPPTLTAMPSDRHSRV